MTLKTNKKLLIVVNVDWFFLSHRLDLAKQAKNNGWIVYVACKDTGRSDEIIKNGLIYNNIPISRSGKNIFEEAKVFLLLYKLYRRLKPDVIHHVTLKPIIYGSLAAKYIGINVVNALSGLGYNFTADRKGFTQKIIIKLMKIGFTNPNTSVIFQNKDDYNLLSKLRIINQTNNVNFIKGSGVDLKKFKELPFRRGKRVTILFPARMLKDKGLIELRAASEILKNRFNEKVTFLLAGFIDEENKAGVSKNFIDDWEDGNYVKWIGYQKDMVNVYAKADIVVLPSYREGMPKSLIEACAIGRPIVTTKAVGCQDCVDEGVNGFKVPIKATKELAEALEKLILSENMRVKMGKASREKAIKEFGLKNVIDKHLDIYKSFFL